MSQPRGLPIPNKPHRAPKEQQRKPPNSNQNGKLLSEPERTWRVNRTVCPPPKPQRETTLNIQNPGLTCLQTRIYRKKCVDSDSHQRPRRPPQNPNFQMHRREVSTSRSHAKFRQAPTQGTPQFPPRQQPTNERTKPNRNAPQWKRAESNPHTNPEGSAPRSTWRLRHKRYCILPHHKPNCSRNSAPTATS